MFFLVRVAFWLSIVILLLPTGKSEQAAHGPQFGTEALTAATGAVADMSQFCSRQPAACNAGSQAAIAFGHKAQASAKMIYDFVTERVGGDEPGSARSADATPASKSADTLKPADRQPAWRRPPAARQDS
jgi:hypothetical protein